MGYKLLLESGDSLLLESGDRLLLEVIVNTYTKKEGIICTLA